MHGTSYRAKQTTKLSINSMHLAATQLLPSNSLCTLIGVRATLSRTLEGLCLQSAWSADDLTLIADSG